MTWLGLVKDAIGGVDGIDGARDILLSPDDQFLYVTGQVDSAIACFERNQTSGSLSYLSTYRDGANGMDGLGAVTSIASTPDGSTIYVTSQHDHSLAWFERNATIGQLTFRNIFRNGEQGSQHLNSTAGAEVSEDGKHLYCIGLKPDGNFTINLFALDPFISYDPTYRGSNSVIKNGENLLDGLWGFSLSGDGRNLYASSSTYASITWLARDYMQGTLSHGTKKGASFVLSEADQGASISLELSYVDGGGFSESLSSVPTAAVEPAYQPSYSNRFVPSAGNLEMIWVEPGTFTMGQAEIATPEHNVTISNGFYLGKYEVTQANYEAVMSGNTYGLNPAPSILMVIQIARWRLFPGIMFKSFLPVSMQLSRPQAVYQQIGSILCPPRRNGNMPVGPEPPHYFLSEILSLLLWPIIIPILGKLQMSVLTHQIPGAFLICMEMYLNGRWTGLDPMMPFLQSIQPVRFPAPCGLTAGVLWIRWVMAMAYTPLSAVDLHQVLEKEMSVFD